MSSANHGLLSVNRRQLIGLGALGAAALALPGRRALAADPLKVAGVFGTPIEEPWVNQIHVALLKAKKDLGVEYNWSENVKAADFARVLREMPQKGANLVMGDAFTDEEASRRVAKDYPKVAFVMGSGEGPAEPNFGVFDNWIHEPAYLSGMIAGKLTKTNTVGAVAAMEIPEVEPPDQRLLRRRQGGRTRTSSARSPSSARSSIRRRRRKRRWPRSRPASTPSIAERFGVIEAAKDKGIIAFSNMSDQSSLAPEHRGHRPGLGHVADDQACDQAGAGRVVHRAGFRRLLLHGQGRLLARPLARLGEQAPAGRQGDGRQAHPADHGRQLPRRRQRERRRVSD